MENNLEVFFCTNMCMFNLDFVPKKGVIAIPADPGNSWYLVSADGKLTKIIEEKLGAKKIDEIEKHDLIYLVDGKEEKETNSSMLKDRLLKVFSKVIFLNESPWIKE